MRRGRAPLLTRAGGRLAAIGAGALVVRLAVVAATPGYRPIHDDASYARVARTLLALGRYPGHHLPDGGWQESAYRPPGWPGVLAATWDLAGERLIAARVVEAAIGAAGVVLVAVLAGQLFGPRPAVAAGVLAAISPLGLAVGASLESETLFTTLVLAAACAALAARRRARLRWAIAAGVLAGLTALTRTNGLLVVPVIALLAVPGAARGARRAVPALAAVLVAVAVIAPWTARNAAVTHAFVPVSTETGNTLAGTYNDRSLHEGARWLEPRGTHAYAAIYRRYGASAQGDAALRSAVVRWVVHHPEYPFVVLAQNTRRMLGLAGPDWGAFSLRTMSFGGGGGVVVWLGVVALSALGLGGFWAARGRGVPVAVWLLLASLFVPAALLNAELRLAAPAETLAIPFAGLAAVRLLDWMRGRAVGLRGPRLA